VIAEVIVHHYGRDELLRRLAHPFWFQSLGAVMGMHWHSSGITTSVIGAFNAALRQSKGSLASTFAAAVVSTRDAPPRSSSGSRTTIHIIGDNEAVQIKIEPVLQQRQLATPVPFL
jgi:Protein of unknown function (DUF763)